MGTADRIVEELQSAGPLSDAELAARLGLRHQAINQSCRALERLGRLRRTASVGAPIRNVLTVPMLGETPPPVSRLLTEDEVKTAARDYLAELGFEVAVAWGRSPGVDIAASKGGERLLLEAKGEAANPPQQVNYFLGAIGELVQRLDDPTASYGLALPDNSQYRGLVSRLPDVALQRLRLVVLFVCRRDDTLEVDRVERS